MSTFLNLTVLQPNLQLPVSIERARQQLRAEGFSVDDALIETYIRAAVSEIENAYSIFLLESVVEEEHSRFPGKADFLFLRKRPVSEILEISYLNTDSVWTQFPTNNVILTKRFETACIVPDVSAVWPDTYCYDAKSPKPLVKVKYKAGYQNCEKIPYDIIHAILYKITLAYERREDPPRVSARASDALLSHHYNFLKHI